MSNRTQVGKVLGKLMAAFNYKPADPAATVKVYAEGLADVPYEALVLGTDAWIKEEQWFPKVAELRKSSRTGKHGEGPYKYLPVDESRCIPGIYVMISGRIVPWEPGKYREFTHD